MNVHGSQLWCFNDNKSINRFYVAWRKKNKTNLAYLEQLYLDLAGLLNIT